MRWGFMTRKDYLKDTKRLVVKVGTSTLTFENGLLNIPRIDKLVNELANLQNKGYEIILVTSGAVGAGMGSLSLEQRPKTLPEKQAIASVGQVALIHLYQKLFYKYGKQIGQLLLTKEDISNRERYLNARNSCLKLISMGIIPIINENDAVVIDEINRTLGVQSAEKEKKEQIAKNVERNVEEYLDEHLPKIKYIIPEGTYLAWLDFS